MTEKDQIYQCRICGNVVQILNGAEGQLSCCGQPMELLVKDADGRSEGHTFEELDNNIQ